MMFYILTITTKTAGQNPHPRMGPNTQCEKYTLWHTPEYSATPGILWVREKVKKEKLK